MVYVFIASCQLIIYGLAWMVSNLIFKGNRVIPMLMLCIGAVGSVFSMYVLGWIF